MTRAAEQGYAAPVASDHNDSHDGIAAIRVDMARQMTAAVVPSPRSSMTLGWIIAGATLCGGALVVLLRMSS